MKNCLIKKLKKSVQNENLIQLNHTRIKLTGTLAIASTSGAIVKSINNNSIPETTIVPDTKTTFNVTDTIVDISDKYNINHLELSSSDQINLDDSFAYCPLRRLVAMVNEGFTGTLEKLFTNSSEIVQLNIRNTSISGDISILATRFNAPSEEITIAYTNVSGDLASLLPLIGKTNKISVQGTHVTSTQATIDAFTAGGVTISIFSSQIVG